MTNIYRLKSFMLRKVRRVLAVLVGIMVTLLFLDFTGTLHAWLGWMAKIQFLPALLALNAGVVFFLLVLTLLFGRIYCSVICPLGIFQDFVAWLPKRRKKNRYSYSPALSWLRYGVLALFVLAMLGGAGSFVALLEPYSAYGRIVTNLFAPVYQWANNGLAYLSERAGSYAFYETEVWLRSGIVFGIAVVTLVAIAVLAWRNGRTYCNAICPVGTVLGFLSKHSLFRLAIDKDKCVSCNLCARRCKASCIDSKNHRIDYSRCVDCMDCVDVCTHGAIHWESRLKKEGKHDGMQHPAGGCVEPTRRKFLSLVALLAAGTALKAQEKKVDGGLAVIEDKKVPERATSIVPPGAVSARHFAQHCTGCQLCVSVCENQVLRPSTDWQRLMQPEMSYERGYCRPECTKCSEACPAGAIRPITVEEKTAIQIGHAVWVKENCVPLTDGVECGNCARHCPTGAILMVHSVPGDERSLKIPVVNEERCIGCGACEYLCPARPFSAIYVEGHEVHRII